MTTLFLKNNSKVEVSFVIMTENRADPIYSMTISAGCGAYMELGNDKITEIFTDDYFPMKKSELKDPVNFPDNQIIIHKFDHYHTPRPTGIRKPDNTLIGVEMRDGNKGNQRSRNKINKRKKN